MKTAWQLVDEANREVRQIEPARARSAQDAGDAVLVDIRDIRELSKMGRVPGAVHAPRGMLEFWFDPESEYHREVFADATKTYILFCAAAGRSALAAKSLQDMGFDNIAHMSDGFRGWQEAELPVEAPDAP